MENVETFGKLFAALVKAQAVMEGASKNNTNPHFKSRYADLSSVWDACRKPLTDNGLCVIQKVFGEHDKTYLTTVLGHESGESISSTIEVLGKDKSPQALGSALTYMRRYSLMAIVGIAPEDDDGEAATKSYRSTENKIMAAPTNKVVSVPENKVAPVENKAAKPAGGKEYTITFGKHKGKNLYAMDLKTVESYVDSLVALQKENGKPFPKYILDFMTEATKMGVAIAFPEAEQSTDKIPF